MGDNKKKRKQSNSFIPIFRLVSFIAKKMIHTFYYEKFINFTDKNLKLVEIGALADSIPILNIYIV